MKVGISKCKSNFDKYLDWLNFFNIEHEVLDYETGKDELNKIHNCSALILSGGTDIYPEIYCDWDTTKTRGTYEPERDGFELNLMEIALEKKMPILGICRGSQLINIYFRGNLIFDIEETRGFSYSKKDGVYQEIDVNIFNNSLAHNIFESNKINVKVGNHQAVERIGEGLMINSKSDHGIVMGIEYLNKNGKGFLLGIQWHPEKYEDYNASPSVNLIERLKKEIEEYTSQHTS